MRTCPLLYSADKGNDIVKDSWVTQVIFRKTQFVDRRLCGLEVFEDGAENDVRQAKGRER